MAESFCGPAERDGATRCPRGSTERGPALSNAAGTRRARPLQLSTWDPPSAWTGTVAGNRENVDKYLCPCVCTCVDMCVHVYMHLCTCFLTRRLAGKMKGLGVRRRPAVTRAFPTRAAGWAQTGWELRGPGLARARGVCVTQAECHAAAGRARPALQGQSQMPHWSRCPHTAIKISTHDNGKKSRVHLLGGIGHVASAQQLVW